MDSIANLLPLAIMGGGIYLFFRWVVRDMNRPTGRQTFTQALPISTPAAKTRLAPSTTCMAARRNGVPM